MAKNKKVKPKIKTKTKSVNRKEKKGKSSVKKDKKKVVKKAAKVEKKVKAKKAEVVPTTPPVKMQKLGKRKKIVHYPPPEVTFMDLAVAGKAGIADLDTHIDAWHESPTATNLLHEYLGMSPKEYKFIISNMENGLQEVLEKRGKKAAKAEQK
jgi:hypothetical protein